MKQARPIYTFAENYLSPNAIKKTVDLARAFVTESEEDYLKRIKDCSVSEFEKKQGVYVPIGRKEE